MRHLVLFILFLSLNLGFSTAILGLSFYFRFREKVLLYFFLFITALGLFFLPLFMEIYFSLIQQTGIFVNWMEKISNVLGGIIFFQFFPRFILILTGREIKPRTDLVIYLGWGVVLVIILLFLITAQAAPWGWILTTLIMGYSIWGLIFMAVHLRTIPDSKLRRGITVFLIISIVYLIWQVLDYILGQNIPGELDLWALPVYYGTIGILSILFLINFYFQARLLEKGVLNTRFLESFAISRREQEIISLLLQGMSNKTVGETLFISTKTVENHIYNIYQKCSVKNRLELFNLAQKYSGS